MKNKMKYIPNDYYEKLSESVRNELLEYRRTSSLIKRKEKSLIKKLENIKILQKEIRLLKSEQTKLYNNVKIFTDDFVPIISIVQYKKGKYIYWNCIVKIRNTIKSIYLGNDKKVRDYIKSEFDMRYNSSVQSIKDKFRYEVFDNITDRITDNYKSFMNEKVSLEDIL
jgi:hypothetical protein